MIEWWMMMEDNICKQNWKEIRWNHIGIVIWRIYKRKVGTLSWVEIDGN